MEFQVVKRSEVKKIVEKLFRKSKSAGYKKLHKRTAGGYAGLNKRQVLVKIVKLLEENADKLFDWFSNNYLKANPDKCHLLVNTMGILE